MLIKFSGLPRWKGSSFTVRIGTKRLRMRKIEMLQGKRCRCLDVYMGGYVLHL